MKTRILFIAVFIVSVLAAHYPRRRKNAPYLPFLKFRCVFPANFT
jgi:hypothetical protein